MNQVLQASKILALLLLVVLIGEAAYTVHQMRPKVAVTVSNLDRTIIIVGAASGDLEKAARSWQAASQAQAQESTAILQESRSTLAAVRQAVTNLDTSLNGSVLPSITKTVNEQSASLLATQEELRKNLAAMQAATTQLQKTLADADKTIADPQIEVTLQNLADTSAQVKFSMEHLNGATSDVQQVADKFRDDFVKPKNRALAYLKAVLGLGSQGRILFNK
jgi:hypothetical protein